MIELSFILLLAPLSILARPTLSPRSSPTFQSIYNFSGVALENLAPRSNGHLLLTASNQPQLYDLDPSVSFPTPIALPPFSDVSGVFGIAETAPDVFAVAAGNYTSSLAGIPGSFSVWSVDMNTPEPTVKLITALPEAGALNGAAALNGFSGSVMIADSALGAIWKVDVTTGDNSIPIQNSDLTAPSGHLGINGLRMSGASLYFTNSAQGTFGRIPVNNGGIQTGNVEILATTTQASDRYDDLDIDSQGNAWVATHPNSLSEVTPGGTQSEITGAGNPTSARFGRGPYIGTLYVVDAGDGTGIGQLVAVTNLGS